MKDKMMSEEEYLAKYDDSAYPKPSVTADIVIIDHKDILLIQRGNHPFMGKWATPGGFANKNEPLEMTAQRELEEETGIKNVSLSLVGIYSKPGRDPRGWVISAAYKAYVNKEDVLVKAGDDAAKARWFTIMPDFTLVSGDLHLTLDDLAFDHKDIIKDALKRA